MPEWLTSSEATGWWVGISVGMFVVGLVAAPVIVTRIRPDYFLHPEPPAFAWQKRHPAVRIAALIAKNLFGGILLIAGIAMLVLPGQGILTILIGVMLLDFPGKRRLEFWIIRRRGILKAINWVRARAHQPPLMVFEEEAP